MANLEQGKMVPGKRDRTSKTIMHVAKGLFEEKGVDNVTFADIAEEANVSRTTVFNHFGSVKGMLSAIGDEMVDEVEQFCSWREAEREPDVRNVYDMLIQDAAYYPALVMRIISTVIQDRDSEQNAIRRIEEMTLERVGGDRDKALMVFGSFYGMISYYYSRGLEFNVDEMRSRMNSMIDIVMK